MKKIQPTPMLWACAALALIAGVVSAGVSANTITLADYNGAESALSCTGCSGFVGSDPVSLDIDNADRYAMPGSSNPTAQLTLLNMLLADFDPARAAVSDVNQTTGDGDGFETNRQYFSIKKSTGMWFFENLSGGIVTVNLEGKTEDYSNWTEYGAAVPVPAAFWLFGTALIGFIGFSRRTKV